MVGCTNMVNKKQATARGGVSELNQETSGPIALA